MPLGFQILKQVTFAVLVGLLATRWLDVLDAVTFGVAVLWLLQVSTRGA